MSVQPYFPLIIVIRYRRILAPWYIPLPACIQQYLYYTQRQIRVLHLWFYFTFPLNLKYHYPVPGICGIFVFQTQREMRALPD